VRGRLVVGGLGVAAATYGAWQLLDDPLGDLVSVALWLAAGVLLHDFVLAPAVLALAWVVGRRLPEPARAPVTVGFVVVGAVTLLAIPVLGRFGASPGNDTLLDRNYVAGWLLLVGLTAGVVGVAVLARTRRRRRGLRPGR
jgi:hypothetical protein